MVLHNIFVRVIVIMQGGQAIPLVHDKGAKRTAGGPQWTKMTNIEKIFEAQKNKRKIQETAQERTEKQQSMIRAGKKCREQDYSQNLTDATVEAVTTIVQKDIGTRLVKVREENRLTQEDVIAELSDFWAIDVTTLSRWETGNRKVGYIYLLWLAQQFDVDLHWLLTGEQRIPKNDMIREAEKKIEDALKLIKKC